jgi:hypothetical protein
MFKVNPAFYLKIVEARFGSRPSRDTWRITVSADDVAPA